MKRLVLVSVIAASMVTTASCARVKNASENVFGAHQTYEGVRFRAKLDSDREDRANFVVTVNDAGQSLSGAREAARHQAVEYCIKQYGLSEIDWEVSPDVEDDAALPIVNGDLIMPGECKGW